MVRVEDYYKSWGLSRKIGDKFKASLEEHISLVREAGRRLDVDSQQLRVHDMSKWTSEEYPIYARQFFDGGDPNFAYAWLHHLHFNPHHWQHWIFPDGYNNPKYPMKMNEEGIMQMPYRYILEMVADWEGASKGYTGSWDMTEWLHKNIPVISLHSVSRNDLREILDWEGYSFVWKLRFKNE